MAFKNTGVAIAAAAAGIAAYGVSNLALKKKPFGGEERWTRTNFKGEEISLAAGPALSLGLATASIFSPAASSVRVAAGSMAVIAGGFGLYDDIAEDKEAVSKGFRGHLKALASGKLTTGAVKILGIGSAAAISSALINFPQKNRGFQDFLTDTILIAASANLLNLLDLRPGRALKAATILLIPAVVIKPYSALPLLPVLASSAPEDLNAEQMFGDCGANALGGVVGVQLAASLPKTLRVAATGAVVALNLASEKVSFSKVIANNSVLAKIDGWGRPG